MSLFERAPFGVIGSITPSTNPTATIINNTISMVAAGNAVVFNVHPSAKECSIRCVDIINRAIVEVGGPANLIVTMAEPTQESAQALMVHRGIRLVVVTGGAGVVEAAMKSGKRAICAGPGNPPIVVDETADLEQAGRDIVLGASFDNNVICTDEKETFAVAGIADKLLGVMRANGAVVLTQSQTKQLENLIFTEIRGPRQSGKINREFIGKNAGVILQKIGMNVPEDLRLGVIDVGVDHPLVWTEQMMPIMPVVRVRDANEAIDLAVAAEGGRRHTAVMHSMNIRNLSRMAKLINCSIFVKNAPCYAGSVQGGEGQYVVHDRLADRRRHDRRPHVFPPPPLRFGGSFSNRMTKLPAIALIELSSIAAGTYAADRMVKRAPVELLHAGTVQPGKYLDSDRRRHGRSRRKLPRGDAGRAGRDIGRSDAAASASASGESARWRAVVREI